MSAPGARLLLAMLLALAGCAPPVPPPPESTLVPTSWADLPGWPDAGAASALALFRAGCGRMGATPAKAPPALAAADWAGACAAAATVPGGDVTAARAFFETRFRPHRVHGADGADGLFTGYYEAELPGARRPDTRFTMPVLAPPADLVSVELSRFRPEWKGEHLVGRVVDGRLQPYPDRAAIEAGALAGQARPLLWLDPVDALLLQVQGSGRIRLEDGMVRVGFAASNGRPYRALGRLMVERGLLSREAMSMQAIVTWLRANSEAGRRLMAENPRYIFFRELAGEGPVGALGVVLTPLRSIAVDPRYIPLGAPLWLDLEGPDGENLRRLALAQDTGAAITGAVRGDVFWGSGAAAFDKAGRMRSRGRYFLLIPVVASEPAPLHPARGP